MHEKILRDIFGFDAFRPGQSEIVQTVARGENTLAIMPTGGGKSLCFQIPALMREGVTVVISPLIALMRDQVRALRQSGVEAGALTSLNSDQENEAIWTALREGRLKLLYMAPERLASGGTISMLRQSNATLIAVDEAHCVSQWGHDFRPDYLRIGALREALGVPLAAFTATADEETREEIIAKLFGEARPAVFLHGFDRPNIHLAFTAKDSPRQQILSFARARRDQSGIVYCGTRAKTETLAKALATEGLSACAYHGGMEGDARREVEERFAREDGLIVAATVAFGMGIDKPDIRWVAHADLPKSIESYYQEIGRAGRDGAPAETLTLFGADDIRFRRLQIDEGTAPPQRRMADHGRLNALLGLAEALGCRRQQLLAYFGEQSEPCGNCDQCDKPPELFDATTAVRMALSAALRTDERFGTGHLIDLVMGNSTDKIAQHGHESLPTFGIGTDFSKREWQSIFRQMMGRDLLRPDRERHGALRMTEAALPLLRGDASITLRKDSLRRASTARATPKAMVAPEDQPLLSALKAKRRALAEAQGVPAFVIFNDRTLIEMTETRPKDFDGLAAITGVGAKKLERYGAEFLAVITGEAQAIHPSRRKLAGHTASSLYDRLAAVQTDLHRGADGLGKPMSCTPATLAKLAKHRPRDMAALKALVGERYAERFGQAFLDALHENA